MRSIIFATSPLLLFATIACAQEKRHLEFHIAGTARDSLYLAGYYGNKLFYTDTAVADANGTVVFQRAKGYTSGVYAVVLPGSKFFEFLVNESEVVMETDAMNLKAHLTVKNSHENQVYLDYLRFLDPQKKAVDQLAQNLEAASDPGMRASLNEKFKAAQKQITDHQLDLIAKNPNTFVAALVKMGIEPDKAEIRSKDGSLDSAATAYRYRGHFWDNTDLHDERILRSPVFQNRFEEYIGKAVPQQPDSINKCADELIHRIEWSDDLFAFAVNNITHKYETSSITEMDAVFVHMVQTYYCPPDGKPGRAKWVAKDKLDALCDRARKEAPLVVGVKSQDLILPDTTEQKWIDLYKVPQEWIYIVFWSPHCGHCKASLPDLYDQYVKKLRPLGVEIFAVGESSDSVLYTDWKAFIREHHLDWVNVGVPWHVYQDVKKNPTKYIPGITNKESMNYTNAWDVYATPKFVLIDGDRRIAGKQITPDQVVQLIAKRKKEKAAQAASPGAK